MPNLIAYDICGVQPMTGPTGLIFAMRSMYDGPKGPNEAFFDEPDPTFSNNYNNFYEERDEAGCRPLNALGHPYVPGRAPGSPQLEW